MKHYSTTVATALTGAALAGDVTLYLADGSTYPDPAVPGNGDYTVIVGYGSSREEVCTVTAKPGANIITVTRGQDGTSATAKNAGDVVVHGVSARDWEELLPLAGGTMTGALFLRSLAPVTSREAAPKQYVDLAVADRATTEAVVELQDQIDALGGWTTYVPTLAQGAATDIAKTVGYAKCVQIGKMVTCQVAVTSSGTGIAGSAVTLSLPVPSASWGYIIGSGFYLDNGTAYYPAIASGSSATTVSLLRADAPYSSPIGQDPNLAVASGDAFSVSITYEAA